MYHNYREREGRHVVGLVPFRAQRPSNLSLGVCGRNFPEGSSVRDRRVVIALVSVIVVLAASVVFLLVHNGKSTTSVAGTAVPGAASISSGTDRLSGSDVLSASNTNRDVPAVRVTTVREGVVGRTVRLTGNVAPARDVTLVSKVPGTVMWTAGEMGTRVEAGDAVVRLDDTELQLAYEQSKAQHAAAAAQLARLEAGASAEEIAQVEAAVEQARLGLERIASVLAKQEELFAQGIISEETILGVRTEHDVARLQYEAARQQLALVKRGATQEERNAVRAQVQQAEVAIKLAEQQLADTVIRAPFSGLLAAQPVQVGTLIGGGTPVGGLVDIDTVVIEANVGERDVNGLRVGQSVNITVEALGGLQIKGVIDSIAPVADRQSRAFPVRFVADNSDHRLKPGMVARVEVQVGVEGVGEAPLVPANAVVNRSGRSVVFVLQTEAGGRTIVRERQILPGETAGGFVAVRSGLAVGDVIVANSAQQNLSDGTSVRVIGEDM